MSTRSLIGIKEDNGTVKAIYCHNDGYPGGVGATLQKYYKNKDKVEKLMSLGDMSSLGSVPESDPRLWDFDYIYSALKGNPSNSPKCCTYKGRGESDVDATIYPNIKAFIDSEFDVDYLYLFLNNKWYYIDALGKPKDSYSVVLHPLFKKGGLVELPLEESLNDNKDNVTSGSEEDKAREKAKSIMKQCPNCFAVVYGIGTASNFRKFVPTKCKTYADLKFITSELQDIYPECRGDEMKVIYKTNEALDGSVESTEPEDEEDVVGDIAGINIGDKVKINTADSESIWEGLTGTVVAIGGAIDDDVSLCTVAVDFPVENGDSKVIQQDFTSDELEVLDNKEEADDLSDASEEDILDDVDTPVVDMEEAFEKTTDNKDKKCNCFEYFKNYFSDQYVDDNYVYKVEASSPNTIWAYQFPEMAEVNRDKFIENAEDNGLELVPDEEFDNGPSEPLEATDAPDFIMKGTFKQLVKTAEENDYILNIDYIIPYDYCAGYIDGDDSIDESIKLKNKFSKDGNSVTTIKGNVIKKGNRTKDGRYVTGFDSATNTVFVDKNPNVDGGADYSVEDIEDEIVDNKIQESKDTVSDSDNELEKKIKIPESFKEFYHKVTDKEAEKLYSLGKNFLKNTTLAQCKGEKCANIKNKFQHLGWAMANSKYSPALSNNEEPWLDFVEIVKDNNNNIALLSYDLDYDKNRTTPEVITKEMVDTAISNYDEVKDSLDDDDDDSGSNGSSSNDNDDGDEDDGGNDSGEEDLNMDASDGKEDNNKNILTETPNHVNESVVPIKVFADPAPLKNSNEDKTLLDLKESINNRRKEIRRAYCKYVGLDECSAFEENNLNEDAMNSISCQNYYSIDEIKDALLHEDKEWCVKNKALDEAKTPLGTPTAAEVAKSTPGTAGDKTLEQAAKDIKAQGVVTSDDSRTFIEKVLDEALYYAKLRHITGRRNYPNIMLQGQGGIGKSSIIRQWAEKNGVNLVERRVSSMDSTDLGGAVAPSSDPKYKGTVDKLPTREWDELDKENSVLFLDEFNRARSNIRDTLMELVNSHLIPDGRVPGGQRFLNNMLFTIAAINPDDNEFEVTPFDSAMKSRWTWKSVPYEPLKNLAFYKKSWEEDNEKLKGKIPEAAYNQAVAENERKADIATALLTNPKFHFDSGEEKRMYTDKAEEDTGSSDSYRPLNPRSLFELIDNSDGRKSTIINKWNDVCNSYKLETVKSILNNYKDREDKANDALKRGTNSNIFKETPLSNTEKIFKHFSGYES